MGHGGERNLHSVQDNEVPLILHDRVCPPFSHFRDTIHTSREDSQICQEDRRREGFELHGIDEVNRVLAPAVPLAPYTAHIIRNNGSKHQQCHDLPDDTGHHQVVAHLFHVFRVGGSGDATSRTLEDEREEITEAEDPCIPFWLYAAVFTADGDDEIFQSEIDGACKEGGGDDETADLDVEAVAVPWIIV